MTHTKKNRQVRGLLFEAYRRNGMFDPHEQAKPIDQRWLGLGTEAAYRPVLEAGLMTFHDGQIPPPRCMGWLCLTEKGIAAFDDLSKEFAEIMAELKRDKGYQGSYVAHYMLAGGLTG